MSDSQTDLFSEARFGDTIGFAFKRLSRVDLPHEGSNQHELNGVNALRELLGDERITNAPIRWIVVPRTYGSEDESEPIDGTYSWYDARENQPERSAEYRLYYDAENGLEEAEEGDSVFVFLGDQDRAPVLLVLVLPAGSDEEVKLLRAFGIADETQRLVIRSRESLSATFTELGVDDVLRLLGAQSLAPGAVTPPLLDELRRRYAGGFPSTQEFSAHARHSVGLPADEDPDDLLVRWLDREETLFRALEEVFVREKLRDGFSGVDDFVSFSLSVQNRRKSRMGFALENHFRALLDARGVPHSYNKVTENNSRPDFVFPGIGEYHDPGFPTEELTVLAAKSTCKERWNQILAEADRVPTKHLLTIDKGIPSGQLEKMWSSDVELVIPEQLHGHYAEGQRGHFLTVNQFLSRVRMQ